MATIIGRDSEQVSDAALDVLANRLNIYGRYLTPRVLEKIHALITDCVPDTRLDSSQTDAAKAIRDRIERDDH